MTKSFLASSYHNEHWYNPGGWQELLIAGTAVELGIFACLAERPQSLDELSDSLNLDRRAAETLLRALTKADYLHLEEPVYSLTPAAAERFGDQKSKSYLGWAVLHSRRLIERWLTLSRVVKSGKPVQGDRFSETMEGFVRAMDVYASPTAEEAVELCLAEKPGAETVLDIGGATGTISKTFVQRDLSAVLFDLPQVIEKISDELQRDWPKIKPAGGDFNQGLPNGPFDIAFLGNITHIYGAEENIALFKRVAASLADGGLIAIQDYVVGKSPSAPFFALNMLVNTQRGGTWTLDEYAEWLTEAGFTDLKCLNLSTRDQQLLIASKN